MKIKELEQLEHVDQLMINLFRIQNQKEELLNIGKILSNLGMLQDKTNAKDIIAAYDHDIQEKITQAIKPKVATTVTFNPQSLMPYLGSTDQIKKALFHECFTNFQKYFLIVLRFNDKKAAWKSEKSTKEFQRLFNNMDQTRHIIHNNCINNLAAINRMTKLDHIIPLFTVWDNPKIKNVKDIPRSDIGNAILKFYLTEVTSNHQELSKHIN